MCYAVFSGAEKLKTAVANDVTIVLALDQAPEQEDARTGMAW